MGSFYHVSCALFGQEVVLSLGQPDRQRTLAPEHPYSATASEMALEKKRRHADHASYHKRVMRRRTIRALSIRAVSLTGPVSDELTHRVRQIAPLSDDCQADIREGRVFSKILT